MQLTETKPQFVDARGEIKDILFKEPIDAVTVIVSKKGVVRGHHYHKETTQWIYLHSGRLNSLTQNPGEGVVARVLRPGDLICSPPHERHAIEALEDSVFYVFTRGPRGGESYETDTFRLDTPLVAPVAAR
ncbi:MAG: cupin domain-containing protein [Magnetococcales bacterium]|nr:cupin domain-containing protein [Magnetococcales bacterium]MBF0321826.1 cupin domain-containing protein [Magnetococcales bacterium]